MLMLATEAVHPLMNSTEVRMLTMNAANQASFVQVQAHVGNT